MSSQLGPRGAVREPALESQPLELDLSGEIARLFVRCRRAAAAEEAETARRFLQVLLLDRIAEASLEPDRSTPPAGGVLQSFRTAPPCFCYASCAHGDFLQFYEPRAAAREWGGGAVASETPWFALLVLGGEERCGPLRGADHAAEAERSEGIVLIGRGNPSIHSSPARAAGADRAFSILEPGDLYQRPDLERGRAFCAADASLTPRRLSLLTLATPPGSPQGAADEIRWFSRVRLPADRGGGETAGNRGLPTATLVARFACAP